jgi:toxin FitB
VKNYLLDTNVVSEVRKPKPHGAVLAWIAGLRNEQIALSAVTLGELQAGVEMTRRQDPGKAQAIEEWINKIEQSFNVLPMTSACFREWGRLMHGTPDELLEDAMIAATARVHGLTVATRNEADFTYFQVDVFNPFRSQP